MGQGPKLGAAGGAQDKKSIIALLLLTAIVITIIRTCGWILQLCALLNMQMLHAMLTQTPAIPGSCLRMRHHILPDSHTSLTTHERQVRFVAYFPCVVDAHQALHRYVSEGAKAKVSQTPT